MPRYYEKLRGHGPGMQYSNLTIPVGICRQMKITPGTHVFIEQNDSDSLIVGVVRRVANGS